MSVAKPSLDTVSNSLHPFGLPLGTVRAFMALLILGYFWLVIYWPSPVKPFLGHCFLLPLVLYSFTLNRDSLEHHSFRKRILPFFLRLVIVLGTMAALAYLFSRGVDHARERLTPDIAEITEWWMPFAGVLSGGLLFGVVLNWLIGPTGKMFQSVRAWLSVVAMVMLSVELGLFVIHLSSNAGDSTFVEFLRYYSLVEIGVVSAYFGTRI